MELPKVVERFVETQNNYDSKAFNGTTQVRGVWIKWGPYWLISAHARGGKNKKASKSTAGF